MFVIYSIRNGFFVAYDQVNATIPTFNPKRKIAKGTFDYES